MLNQRTTIMWVILAAVLFTVLLGARSLVSKVAYSGPDAGAAYDELGQALEQAHLLPLGRDDEFLMNLTHLAKDISTVHPQDDPAMTGDILTIGNVLQARSRDQKVVELRLRPEYHRELMPGTLPDVLRKIVALPRTAQIKAGPVPAAGGASAAPPPTTGSAGAPPANSTMAQFTFMVARENYTCQVLFMGNDLDELLITKK